MPNYMTRDTFKRLQERLDFLVRKEKPAIVKEIKVAKEHGDLRENAEYHAAKDKQKVIYAEIENLVDRLDDVQFIENLPIDGDRISIGTQVSIQEENGEKTQFTILGPEDADSDNHIISFMAPLAKGLIGKVSGEEAILQLPGKTKKVKVLEVKRYET